MEDERRLPPDQAEPWATATAGTVSTASAGVAAETLEAWELLARFRSTEALDQAIVKLEAAGFGRGDLGLPEMDPPPERATPEAGSKSADTDLEAQQSRVFLSAVGGAAAAMVAATAVAATGGLAAVAGGVALGAGAAAAGVAHLLSRGLSHSEQLDREQKAAEGKLILAVRTLTPEKRDHAIAILDETGGELL